MVHQHPPTLEYINRRLGAWARWIHSGRVLPQGYVMRSAESRIRDELGATGKGARVAVPNPECEEIERLVRLLPVELRQALDAHYVRRMRDDMDKARYCSTSVSEYFQRLRCAKYCLWGLLQAPRNRCIPGEPG